MALLRLCRCKAALVAIKQREHDGFCMRRVLYASKIHDKTIIIIVSDSYVFCIDL